MYINSLFTQSAAHRYSSAEIIEILSRHFDSPAAADFVSSRIRNSGIKFRNFCRPLEEILGLNGLKGRAEIFAEETHNLFDGLKNSVQTELKIEGLITTSCSVPTLPARDLDLINTLDIKSNPLRIPVYQHGCIGGVWPISLAQRMNLQTIMVCSYELCSLLFQPKCEKPSQMMGAILFSDGLGAAIIESTPRNPLVEIIDSADLLIPQSSSLLGYDLLDSATQLVLSPQIPAMLADYFPEFISKFLALHNLHISDIAHFLAHPGGLKILDQLQQSLGIDKKLLQSSYDILRDFGNLSSASIFMVLDNYLKSESKKSGDHILILGVGPGISLQLVLCKIP